MGKGGYSDCLAISFAVGHYAKQCHAFQAKSNREVNFFICCWVMWGVNAGILAMSLKQKLLHMCQYLKDQRLVRSFFLCDSHGYHEGHLFL